MDYEKRIIALENRIKDLERANRLNCKTFLILSAGIFINAIAVILIKHPLW